ncbi:Conserved_hypothetical protein [Hexamita inflata]|uniref:RING-type domain-containing protein n=1 Tax=Hexamita inflata TaxID=28002 RepID=A0AA86NHN1_9EUKA|nr:Conserved hypothetical protein [Hexamita inflata]
MISNNISRLFNISYPKALDISISSGYFSGNQGIFDKIVQSTYFFNKGKLINLIGQNTTFYSEECNIQFDVIAHNELMTSNVLAWFVLICLSVITLIYGIYLQQTLNNLDVKLNFTLYIPKNINNARYNNLLMLLLQNLDIVLQLFEQTMFTLVIFMLSNSVLTITQLYTFYSFLNTLSTYFVDFQQFKNVQDIWHIVFNKSLPKWTHTLIIFLLLVANSYIGQALLISNQPRALDVLVYVSFIKWFFKTLKYLFQPSQKCRDLKLQLSNLFYFFIQQVQFTLIWIQIRSTKNVFSLQGDDTLTAFYVISSFSFLAVNLFLSLFKTFTSRQKKIKFDLSFDHVTYNFALNLAKIDNEQINVLVPFQKPKQLIYKCNNPFHSHSDQYQNQNMNFLVINENGIKQFNEHVLENKNSCYLLCDLSSLQHISCPVCFEEIDLTKTGQLHVNGQKSEAGEIKRQQTNIAVVSGNKEIEVCSTQCGHMFHRECIEPWVAQGNTVCPMCRKSLLQ